MKYLDQFFSAFKRLRSGVAMDPVRDWLVLLTLGGLVLASIIVWNVWAFDTVARGGAIGGPPPKATPIFDSASLETIRSIFETRAQEEAKYLTGAYRFADPSQ
jgi:hypothetical protein